MSCDSSALWSSQSVSTGKGKIHKSLKWAHKWDGVFRVTFFPSVEIWRMLGLSEALNKYSHVHKKAVVNQFEWEFALCIDLCHISCYQFLENPATCTSEAEWVEKIIQSHNHSLLLLCHIFFPLRHDNCSVRSSVTKIFVSLPDRKDESKEPIVEVRTEDECTANHNAAGPTEPNETTPLTEPEWVKTEIQHTAFLPLKSF